MRNLNILGDCLEIMAKFPNNYFDLILADLPYGSTQNKWDIIIPFDQLWEEYLRISKDNAAIILFGQGIFSAKLRLSNEKMFRYDLIWQKTSPTGHLNAKRMPLRDHEDINVFYKKLPTYNPQKTTGHPRKISSVKHKRNSKKTTNYGDHKLTSYDSTERYPKSVWTFPTDKQKSSLHPTQKPVALLEKLIKSYSNPGDIVLDNTAGVGSTGKACQNTNRYYVMIEKEKDNWEKSKLRMKNGKKI